MIMPAKKSLFSLLLNKDILVILEGDTEYGEYEPEDGISAIKIKMPYLTGPNICEISSTFGYHQEYSWKSGALSRWEYLSNLLKFCIENGKISELLAYLFNKNQFAKELRGHTAEIIEKVHKHIIETVISQINGVLYLGGNELVVVGKRFIVKPIDKPITIDAPKMTTIDRSYIVELSQRAIKDIEDGNGDSAITKARTLLEEVFCYVIEKRGETPSDSGDIGKIYNQVKNLYGMQQSKDYDKRVNGLLSGLEKILSAIAEMRNTASDSHGVGSKRIKVSDYHARLFVNSATTMAEFILAVAEHYAKWR